MKLSAEQLFQKLTQEYGLIGQTGAITFSLNNFSIEIQSKDSIGNLIQEWLTSWMTQQGIEFEKNPSSQKYPDIFLDIQDKKKGLLEIKAFDFKRGPGFDLANLNRMVAH